MTSRAFTAQTPQGPIAGWVDGDGAPLLLLHGGPGMSEYLTMLGPEVGGWQAIRYQQRGLAPSASEGPFTMEQHVADAIAVLDELQLGQVTVLGHSWGGHLAMHVALAHPDRVTGLVLVDPLGAIGDGGAAELMQHLVERMSPESAAANAVIGERLAGPDPAVEDMTASLRLLWPGYFGDPDDIIPYPPDLRLDPVSYIGTFGSIAEHLAGGFAAKLAGVTVPVVFVLGGKSPMPVSQGEQTAALLPAARVVVVPDAGHMPWHEQPGCVAAVLDQVRG
jgi:pimeloyl-ACP methyl ester carboxylesterase